MTYACNNDYQWLLEGHKQDIKGVYTKEKDFWILTSPSNVKQRVPVFAKFTPLYRTLFKGRKIKDYMD